MNKKLNNLFPTILIGLIFIIVVIFLATRNLWGNESVAQKSEPIESVNLTTAMTESTTATSSEEQGEQLVINVWDSGDELLNIVSKYKELHPDCPATFQLQSFATADVWYTGAVMNALEGYNDIVPDIFVIEVSNLHYFTEGDCQQYVSSYEELGIDLDSLLTSSDIPQYVVDMGTNEKGERVALGYQSTSSAFIYRRSIAKDVWGTDDPIVIGDKIGPGWDKFFAAAEELKQQGYSIVSGNDDLWYSASNGAEKNWIVDGKLYLDPKREAYIDIAKKMNDNGYTNNTVSWLEAWFNDMQDAGPRPVFGYMGPAWMVNYVLPYNSGGEQPGEGTYGDWAVCMPPEGFSWGGNFVFVNKESKAKEVLADIVEWITLDSSETGLQYLWANGLIKNTSGKKDTVYSRTVMRNSDGSVDFLGGQNMFDIFIPSMDLVNGELISQNEIGLDNLWIDQVREYVNGNKSRDQAIADFKQGVKDEYGIDY